MSYEMKEGSFTLFKNKRKETDNHPDYTGSIMVDGVERWCSAWLKTPKSGGEKYMSGSVGKPKEPRAEQPRAESRPAPVADLDDDLPF
jgi:uncharacterized protein (DUF736 family)